MAQLMVSQSKPLKGSIKLSGAKNSSLPLMAACLLTTEPVKLINVPQISDVDRMKEELLSYGVEVSGRGTPQSPLVLNASQANFSPQTGPGKRIRGAFNILGPLMARFGEAEVYQPGGCQIGKDGRPVDFHLKALEKMGATKIRPRNQNSIALNAKRGLRGATINFLTDSNFPKVSVGATENIVMAATLAVGQTTITNAAVEPEVIDLVTMLNKMGANIQLNKDSRVITIDNRPNGRSTINELLSGTTHTVIPDRIEAGTYAIAAAITGGQLLLKMDPDVDKEIFVPVIEKLKAAGVQVTEKRDGLEVCRRGQIRPVSITTGPYPEFPTDLLPQWVSFMTQANGKSTIQDTIYDNRFKLVPDLEKMGAVIKEINETKYEVYGKASLKGTRVVASDLRAGAALILAALVAEGTTVVKEFEHLLRGYENIEEKLEQCGVQVRQLLPTRPGFYGFSPQ